MNAPAPTLRSRIVPALAATAVAAALGGAGWYGVQAIAARPIGHIELGGDVARLAPADLDAFTQGLRGLPVGSVSLAEVRARARRIPWVRDASVRRVPDGLAVTFETYGALARWNANQIISPQGEIFVAPTDAALPLAQGPDETAPLVAQRYPALVAALAPLGSPLAQLNVSARGAWQVVLESGLVLELGRGDFEPPLARFVAAWPGLVARGVETKHADLRYANGFAIRQAATVPPPKDSKARAAAPRKK